MKSENEKLTTKKTEDVKAGGSRETTWTSCYYEKKLEILKKKF